jgi:hypothetical protein
MERLEHWKDRYQKFRDLAIAPTYMAQAIDRGDLSSTEYWKAEEQFIGSVIGFVSRLISRIDGYYAKYTRCRDDLQTTRKRIVDLGAGLMHVGAKPGKLVLLAHQHKYEYWAGDAVEDVVTTGTERVHAMLEEEGLEPAEVPFIMQQCLVHEWLDQNDPHMLPSHSVDLLMGIRILPHLDDNEVKIVLEGSKRILKQWGIFFLAQPFSENNQAQDFNPRFTKLRSLKRVQQLMQPFKILASDTVPFYERELMTLVAFTHPAFIKSVE